jgi:hypothetical protein
MGKVKVIYLPLFLHENNADEHCKMDVQVLSANTERR